MNILIHIEKGSDGTYNAYMDNCCELPFGIIGEGNSIDEAINDILEVYVESAELYYQRTGVRIPTNSFDFIVDAETIVPHFFETHVAL